MSARPRHDFDMPDATALASALQPLLSIQIKAIEFHPGILAVTGDRWSLNLIGEWTWHPDTVVVTDANKPRSCRSDGRSSRYLR
jgi:hypothetical protein